MPLASTVAEYASNMLASIQEATEKIAALTEQVRILTAERDELLAEREQRAATPPIVGEPKG